MAARRPHNKSRTGCDQCKLKRIKCDEHRPVCCGCSRRGTECVYSGAQRSYKASPNSSSIDVLRATELELMHHFTLWTYNTCDHGIMSSTWWQETLPMLATRHDYLLHALFAFTSLHIAHLRPADASKYTALALMYRDKTLKTLPTVFNCADLVPEQADACFWASAIVGLILLGQYHQTSLIERPTPKALLLELAALWRGAQNIGKVHTSTSSSPAHSGRQLPTPVATPDTLHTEFGSMVSEVRRYIESEDRNKYSEEFIDVCIVAVNDLASAVSLLESEDSSSGIISWFSCLDKQLLDEMSKDVANELIDFIIVFYGVALYMIKDTWYIQGLGVRLIEDVASGIPLKHREKVKLVNWAREQVCL